MLAAAAAAVALALPAASAPVRVAPPTLTQLVGQHPRVRMQGSRPSADLLARIRNGEIGGGPPTAMTTAAAARVQGVATGRYPAYGDTWPAALSPSIVTKLLRNTLHFHGAAPTTRSRASRRASARCWR